MAKSYRKITLQSGAVRYYRADIYEEGGPHGGAKLYESIPDGEILLESAIDFDDRLGIDNKPTRNNGSNRSSVVTESNKDLTQMVEQFGRSYGWSKAESILFLHEPPKMHGAYRGISESDIRGGWKKFDDILSESEIETLVRGRVVAPEKRN